MLYLWFITNGPAGKDGDIPGDVISEMAVELVIDFRFEVSSNFKFSNSWFEGFKEWYNVKQYTSQGKGASSNAALIESGREEIVRFIAQYEPHLVYNMDETAKRKQSLIFLLNNAIIEILIKKY